MSDDPSDSWPGPTPTADSSPGPGIHAGDVRHDDNGAMEPPSPAVMATSTASGVTTRQQPSQHHHESSYSVGMQEPVPPHAQTLASETQVMQELSLPLPMQMPAPGAHEAQIPRMHMQVTQVGPSWLTEVSTVSNESSVICRGTGTVLIGGVLDLALFSSRQI